MTVLTPASSVCSFLVESPELGPRSFGCKEWYDEDLSSETEHNLKKLGTIDTCTAVGAATIFIGDAYVDLLDLGDGVSDPAEDEARILDDLLRLGLELGDLENVFGNTEIDTSQSPEVQVIEESQVGVVGGEETGGSEASEVGGPELVKNDAEELLLDADLQDALLALPTDATVAQDENEPARNPTGAIIEADIKKGDKVPPSTPILATSTPSLATSASAAPPLTPPDVSLGAGACAPRADPAGPERDGAETAGAATAVIAPKAAASSATATFGTQTQDGAATVVASSPRATPDCEGTDGGTPAAPGVPIHLLDAIDLWESANAQKKAGAKKILGKKKNEFGKRRRSSGSGGASPCLDPALGTSSSSSRAGGRAGGERRVKKDPLASVKDVRHLSRKPLIVQWLRSDGCELDVETESTVGEAVGKLSVIYSHYWSGGG